MKHLFHLAYIKSPFMFMDVSTDLTCLQGIQASFKRGLVLLRVAASTESQISSTFLNSNSESVAFSFARYINGKRCEKRWLQHLLFNIVENHLLFIHGLGFGFSSLSNGESSPNLTSIRYT